jgi:hypothetical protein
MQHSVYYVFKNMWVVKETMSSKRSFSEIASDLASQATRVVRNTSFRAMGQAAITAAGSAARGVAVSLGVMDAPTTVSGFLQVRCDRDAVVEAAKEIFDVQSIHNYSKKEFCYQLLQCACAGVCVQVTDEIRADDEETGNYTGDMPRIVKEHFRYLVKQGTNAKARKFARLWHTDEAKVDKFIIKARQQQEIDDARDAELAAETLLLQALKKKELALRVRILENGLQLLDDAAKDSTSLSKEIQDAAPDPPPPEAAPDAAPPDAAPDAAPPDAAPDAACSHLDYLCEYGSDEDLL